MSLSYNGGVLEHDLIRARRVGDRLRSTFTRVLESLPPEARTIGGMSRWLGVHKATCQRVVEGTTRARDELEAFERFPGVDGMKNHLRACAERAVDATRVAAADAAVDDYAQFLREVGHTQRSLIAELSRFRGRSPDAKSEAEQAAAEHRRRTLYEAAREFTGEESECKAVVAVISGVPGEPGKIRITVGSRLAKIVHRSFARPISPFRLTDYRAPTQPTSPGSSDSSPAGLPVFRVLDRLSSAGLRVNTIETAPGRTILVAEPQSRDQDGSTPPVDLAIVFAPHVQSDPRAPGGVRLSLAARIVEPARALVLDLYIERALQLDYQPTIQCVTPNAPPGDRPGVDTSSLWHERFPEWPTLVNVGVRPEPAGSALHPRVNELASETLAMAGLVAEDCSLTRCEVRYPVWQSEYRVTFDPPGA